MEFPNAHIFLAMSLLATSGCENPANVTPDRKEREQPMKILFEFVEGDTAIVVPATINGKQVQMVLDTGAGIEALATNIAKDLGIKTTEILTGKRLNGDPLTIEMGAAESLSLGNIIRKNWLIAPLDYFDRMSKEINVQGLLSLKFFEDRPFTIDYPQKFIVLETPESLAKRRNSGFTIPLFLTKEFSQALGVEIDLEVDRKWRQRAVVDTGSAPTKLDMPYFQKMGLSPHDPRLQRKSFNTIAKTRVDAIFLPIPGRIRLAGSEIDNDNHPVRFQENLSAASI